MKTNNILSNLEYLMSKNNLTKSGLAKLLELSNSTVYSWWTRGTDNISISTLIKLSRLFNTTMDRLVLGSESLEISEELTSYSKDTEAINEIKNLLKKYYEE